MMTYLALIGTCLFISTILNVYLYLQIRKPKKPESVNSKSAEELLSELAANGAVNIQVFPASDYILRSPRG